MNNTKRNPVLVTGSHRAGTSWVGKMISLSPSMGYIHEPFNLRHSLGICGVQFDYWFQYICNENEGLYLDGIKDCLQFKYHLLAEFRAGMTARSFAKSTLDYMYFTKCRILKKQALVKDPLALFSAQWLAQRFGMDVVTLIRHPAAFACSLKQKNWTHPFNHFLEQPLLMDRYLSRFRSTIEEYAKTEQDIINQAILLWNIIYSTVLKYKHDNTDWLFVRHEDIARNPVEEFGHIYDHVGLTFSPFIQRKIEDVSSGWSASNIFAWKTLLTGDEIKRIKDNTHEVASAFYTEKDWIG